MIVTGSEGDLGKAICKKLREVGAIVYGFDIRNNVAEDVTNESSFFSFFRFMYLKHKRIDVLINNAGINGLNYDSSHLARFHKTLEINLVAPYNLSRMVAEHMKKNRRGSIINITSLWSEIGFSGNPGYGASKGGLKQLTKALACDFAPYGIRVNNIGLGYFKSNMTKKSLEDKQRYDIIKNRTLLKRWGDPKDILGAVIFLASDASAYITGQDIYVDGGWLAWGGI